MFLWQPEWDPGDTGTCSNCTRSLLSRRNPLPPPAAMEKTLHQMAKCLGSILINEAWKVASQDYAEGPFHKDAGLSN